MCIMAVRAGKLAPDLSNRDTRYHTHIGGDYSEEKYKNTPLLCLHQKVGKTRSDLPTFQPRWEICSRSLLRHCRQAAERNLQLSEPIQISKTSTLHLLDTLTLLRDRHCDSFLSFTVISLHYIRLPSENSLNPARSNDESHHKTPGNLEWLPFPASCSINEALFQFSRNNETFFARFLRDFDFALVTEFCSSRQSNPINCLLQRLYCQTSLYISTMKFGRK